MKKPPARPTFYDPLDWVVIRSPLLPIDAYLALSGGSSSSHAPPIDRPSSAASSPPGGASSAVASSAVAPPAARRWRTEARSAQPADPLVKLALRVVWYLVLLTLIVLFFDTHGIEIGYWRM